MSGVGVVAAICGLTGGVLGFAQGLSGKPLDLATSTKRSASWGGGHSRRDYRRAGFSDEDISIFGLDQPGAPPPDIAPYVVDDLMRRDDPWDADFWGGEDIDPLDGPDPDGFDLDFW